MGIETAIIIGATVAAVGGVASGVMSQNEANHQARVAEAEANNRAGQTRREYEKLRKTQKVSFLTSGVSLEGSPLLVMDETTRLGEKAANDYLDQGRNAAKDLRRQGRNALFSGIMSGIGSGAKVAGGYGKATG